MIKLLIGIIFLIVAMVFRLIVAGIGAVSTVTNKRGTFINFGTQYLKQTNVCYRAIVPYMSQLVDDILIYSKGRNYTIADETEFIETVLYRCVCALCPEETILVHRPQPMQHIEREAVIYSFQFLSKYNIKN